MLNLNIYIYLESQPEYIFKFQEKNIFLVIVISVHCVKTEEKTFIINSEYKYNILK